MSIKVYWGSNGSFKTASAVQDDIIPELLKGRVVITNVRGCTLDKCIEQYPDIPDTADVIYIDMAKAGSLDKLQTWFRWAPQGALIVLDEVQLIHRQSWRDRDLEKFVLQVDDGGVRRAATFDEAEQLGQPYDMLDAFTRHRHWNWDLVLTTPNIKYVRSDIRNTCEVAYRQANGALLGFSGRFKRAMHDADENKPGVGALTQTLKIKQKSFACYDSTRTGKVQDTRAGTNIFKSPRLLLALACSAGGFIYAFASGGFDIITGTPHSENLALPQQAAADAEPKDGVPAHSVPGSTVAASVADSIPAQQAGDSAVESLITEDIFAGYDAALTYFEGFQSGKVVYFLVEFDHWGQDGHAFSMSSGELVRIGYRFKWLSECAVLLMTQNTSRLVTCWRPRQDTKSEIDVPSDDFNPVNQVAAAAKAP